MAETDFSDLMEGAPLDERQRIIQQNWDERRRAMGPLPEPTPEQQREADALVRAELDMSDLMAPGAADFSDMMEGVAPAPTAAEIPNPWYKGDQEFDEVSFEDSWVDLGRKVVENAPAHLKSAWGGILQFLGERKEPIPFDLGPDDPLRRGALKDYFAGVEQRQTERGKLAAVGRRLYEEAYSDLAANAPDVDPDSLKGYAYDIAQATVQMAPMIATALVTRSPGAALAVMGGQVGGERYGQSRRPIAADVGLGTDPAAMGEQPGRRPDQATADAIFYAAAEAIPERIPLGILMKSGTRLAPRVLKAMGAEAIQEMFTEVLQKGYDAGILREDMTWGDAMREIGRAGIIGAGMGGTMATAIHPFVRGEGPLPDFSPGTAAPAPAPPGAMPQPGEAIGLKFPNAPPRRATVETYFDNGRAVRVRFDDGSIGDFLAADVARDRTEPPPPREDVRETAPPAGPTETEAFDMMMAGDLPPPRRAGRGTGSMTQEAELALNRAMQLERMASDPRRDLSPGQRLAYVEEAALLRQQYGHQPGAAVAGAPAVPGQRERFETARMGELGMARLRDPLEPTVPSPEAAPTPPAIAPPVREEAIAPAETPAGEGARPEAVERPGEGVPERPEIPQRREGAPLQQSGFVTVSPDMLTLDPERFQYKAAQGPRGVTGALAGVQRWEPALANPITAWLANDGRMYVVNGHQRTDLALRAQEAGQQGVEMPARVFRESDGYTAEDMRTLGALQNIAEGSGTASDAARVLRQVGQGTERFKLPELPPRSQLVQDAKALAALSDDAFKMVENGLIPEPYAAQVGRLISDPAEQVAAIDALTKAEPANVEQARIMVQDIRNSGFLRGEQTTLFGTEQVAQSLFAERARVLENALRTLRRLGGTFRTAVEQESTLAAAGNVMETEANIRGRTENERLYATLRVDATRRGPLSDALSAAAAEIAEGKAVGPVTSRFLSRARKLVAEGEAVRPGAETGGERPPGPSLFQRVGPRSLFQTAWHGGPHDFDRFDTSKIGTGEGAQAYGYGLYFASKREIAEHYRDALAGRQMIGGKAFARPKGMTDAEAADVQDVLGAFWGQWNTSDLVAQIKKARGELRPTREYVARLKKLKAEEDPALVKEYPEIFAKRDEEITRYEKALQQTEQAARVADIIDKYGLDAIKPKGRLYKVDLAPAETDYLLWDKPLSEQSEKVKAAVERLVRQNATDTNQVGKIISAGGYIRPTVTGESVYRAFSKDLLPPLPPEPPGAPRGWGFVQRGDEGQKAASLALREAGIRGIKYLDQGSRRNPAQIDALKKSIAENEKRLADIESGRGDPSKRGFVEGELRTLRDLLKREMESESYNYVIFDEADVAIEAKFQRPSAMETLPRPGAERVSLAEDVQADMRPTELYRRHEKRLLRELEKTAARIFPGARVRMADRLYGLGESGFDPVGGVYLNDPRARVMLVSLESADIRGTLLHEGIHHLYRSGILTDAQWRTLEQAAIDGDWIAKHNIIDRYGDRDMALALEEAIAEQFRVSRRARFQDMPLPVRRIFLAIERFLRALRTRLREILGRDVTAADLFSNIETGRVARQAAGTPEMGGAAFYRTQKEAEQDARHLERTTGYVHEVIKRKTPGLEADQYFISNRMLHARDLLRMGAKFADLEPEFQDWLRRHDPHLAAPTPEPKPETEIVSTVEGPRDQYVIPGMEKSAVQAAKARGEKAASKVDQKAADVGLFAVKRGRDGQGSLFQRPEQPRTAPEGREYFDNVADDLADTLRGQGPGNYERRLAELLRPSGQMKELGSLEQFAILPRTLARIDEPSSRYWDAWTRRDDMVTQTDHKRAAQAKSYVALNREQQRALHAVEELDRINGTVRADDGRRIVARNDGVAEAELSRPGDAITLDAATTQAYRDRRAMFRDVWRDLIDATAKKMGWDGPADPTVIRVSADLASDRRYAEDLRRLAELVEGMQAQERTGYVPLMRFGDHYIAVKPKPGTEPESLGGFPETARFELVETQPSEWRIVGKRLRRGQVPDAVAARIAELRQRYPESDFDIEHGQLFAKADILRKLDIPAIERLQMLVGNELLARSRQAVEDGVLTKAEADRGADVFGQMVEYLRSEMYRELTAGFKKRARTVPGYSTDFRRATGSYLGWTTRHAADLVHGDEIRRIKDNVIARHPNRRVREYWDDWARYQDRDPNTLEMLSTGLQRAAFLWQMAMNPSSAAVNLFDTPMRAHPNLMVGNGLGPSTKELYGAMRQALRKVRTSGDEGLTLDFATLGRTPAERALIKTLEENGTLRQSLAHDLAALGQDRGAMPEEAVLGGRRAFRIAASNLSVVDKINRSSMALAAYRLAQRPGALDRIAQAWGDNEIFRRMVERDGLTPESYARFMVDEGLGVWGQRNRAPMQRGALGTMVFQWKNYYAQQLAELTKMMTRMGPEGKKAAALMLGTIAMSAGALGLPFAKDIGTLVNAIWNAATGDSGDVQEKLQTALVSAGMGKEGAEAVLVGPSRYFLGVDLAPRLGFGDQVSNSLQPWEAFGAVPGMIARLGSAIPQEVKQGRYGRAATELAPAVVRNPATAFGVYPKEGVRTRPGSQVIPREKITLQDQIARALGFQSAHIARAYEERRRVSELGTRHREKVRNAVARIADLSTEAADARAAGDMAAVRRLEAEMARVAASAGVRLTAQQIIQRLRALESPEQMQLRRAPKAVRGRAAESPFPTP